MITLSFEELVDEPDRSSTTSTTQEAVSETGNAYGLGDIYRCGGVLTV